MSSIANQSQAKIRKLYEEAINLEPSIIIIEDLDNIAGNKDSNNKESEKKLIFQLANSLEIASSVSLYFYQA